MERKWRGVDCGGGGLSQDVITNSLASPPELHHTSVGARFLPGKGGGNRQRNVSIYVSEVLTHNGPCPAVVGNLGGVRRDAGPKLGHGRISQTGFL